MNSGLLTRTMVAVTMVMPAYAADAKIQTIEVGSSHMEFPCAARGQLRQYVRSGEIRIVGSDNGRISVDLTGKNVGKIQDLTARLTCMQNVWKHFTGIGLPNDQNWISQEFRRLRSDEL